MLHVNKQIFVHFKTLLIYAFSNQTKLTMLAYVQKVHFYITFLHIYNNHLHTAKQKQIKYLYHLKIY
jgi:hypothetical protein